MCEGSTFSDVFEIWPQKIPMKPIKKLDLGTMERGFLRSEKYCNDSCFRSAHVALKIALWSCQQQSYRQTRLPVWKFCFLDVSHLWLYLLPVKLTTTCCHGDFALEWHYQASAVVATDPILSTVVATQERVAQLYLRWIWAHAPPCDHLPTPTPWSSPRSYNCLGLAPGLQSEVEWY